MRERIPVRLLGVAAALLIGVACLGAGASAAGAAEVAYNNLNTVAPTVNGLPNEDTFSLDFEYFATGGQVQLAGPAGRAPISLKTQLDVFACEHGVYSLENCFTLKPNKKFASNWTAGIYAVGAGNSVGALLSSATATFKLHYRPTTNVSCPATGEGKGFGANCDVGGYLQTVTFKHFTAAALPEKVIILLSNPCGDCSSPPINVGLQSSYKEFAGGEFVAEGPAAGGVPAVGSDPLPDDIYSGGALNEGGWTGFQPVFELTVRRH